MKRHHPGRHRPSLAHARRDLAAALFLLAAGGLRAASGTWVGASSPLNWEDAANWSGGIVADGAGFTADFGATDINGFTVVQLNAPRTVGSLVFGDSGPATPGSWSIGNNGNNANSLALVGTPATILVPDLGTGQNVAVSAALAGSGGLTKTGAGVLIAYGNKSYSGDTRVEAGTFVTTNPIPGGTDAARTALFVANGATLEYRAIFGDIAIRPSNISGAGVILKTGPGMLTFAGTATSAAGGSTLSLSSAGLVDIREGAFRLGNWNSQNNSMAGNQAAFNVAAGATLNIDSTNAVLGSLTGAGTVSGGYYGPRSLTIGSNNASTTFSGSITTNASLYNANSSPTLIKVGSGALTLTGSANIRAAFGQNVLTVGGGTASSSSTLNLYFTGPSQIGVIEAGGSGNGVSFGQSEGDFVVVDQTAGAITTPLLNIGRQGTTTYSLGGSAVVNAFDLRLAETGPFTGSGAVTLNISGSAQLRVIAGGTALMGQFYGRPLVVNQTGGLFGFFEDLAGSTRGGSGSLAFRSANTAVTYNLSGGTLSLPAITRTEASGGSGGGNAVFNLDGGTLQITSDSFSVPDGEANGLPFFTFNVREGGVVLDPHGRNVAFNVPLRHAGAAARDGGLIVSGANGGSLTLSAANSYNGDTVVQSGASLTLSSSGRLAFSLAANGSGTRLLGSGAVTLDGTFVIDLSQAALANGNTWQLVAGSTLSETYGDAFAVEGFTETSPGVWTRVDGANTWTFSETSGALSLSAPVTTTPYSAWATAEGLDGSPGKDAAPSADPDGDTLSNLLEFALSGRALVADGALTHARQIILGGQNHLTLTIAARSGAVFSGSPSPSSAPVDGVAYSVQGSTDLTSWSLPLVEATGAEIAALHASLPALPTGWTYRSFRPVSPLSAAPRAFLRVQVQ